MTDARTVEATTAHGTVEYQIVTCVNCGTEVVPDESVPIGIGEETYTCDGLPFCRTTHRRPREVRALCSYCAAELVGYDGPADGVTERLDEFRQDTSTLWLGVWLGTVLAIALTVATILLRLLGIA